MLKLFKWFVKSIEVKQSQNRRKNDLKNIINYPSFPICYKKLLNYAHHCKDKAARMQGP
jgi:hypothetical protein